MVSGNEVGELLRRLRRRQRWSRLRLADRIRRISGDHAMNPARLRQWEIGKDMPDAYWRGWLAMALGVPRDVLDRSAASTDGHRRTRRRVQAAARGRPVQGWLP
jgi:transcriptional regulator with XRE-family HTH domain